MKYIPENEIVKARVLNRPRIHRSLEGHDLSEHIIGPHNLDDFLNTIPTDGDVPEFIIVDLFCGAGGTSTGFEMAGRIAKVIACINHDFLAILSHWHNHPHVAHFNEDIRTLDLTPLKRLVAFYRKLYPKARLILWASLECTNFSKAKGGQPRDADSRTLADHLHRYVEAINPDYVQIENVVEFMSWGPLDENGKPLSRRNGVDFLRWCNEMDGHGFRHEWRELNSADFGAYTSRNRLFGIFARPGLPIVWPEPTHAKKVKSGMFGSLVPWRAVKEVLELGDRGPSYFNPGRIRSDATHWRVLGGLKRFCSNPFISTYYGGNFEHKTYSLDAPARTITAQRTPALLSSFLMKYFTGAGMCQSIDAPGPTIRTKDGTALMNTTFIMKYHGTGNNCHSADGACPTLDTGDRCAPVTAVQWLDLRYSSGQQFASVEAPAGTTTTVPKHSLMAAQFINEQYGNSVGHTLENATGTLLPNPKQNLVSVWIVNPQFKNTGSSVNHPCPTMIAMQDKRPLQLAEAIYEALEGEPLPAFIKITADGILYEVYDTDSEPVRLIKEFMARNGIVDVRMRMLKVPELLRIQGFPAGYQLAGNQSDQKKFIGNSVVPLVVKAWIEALSMGIVGRTIVAA